MRRRLLGSLLATTLAVGCAPSPEDTMIAGTYLPDDKSDTILYYEITLEIDRTVYASAAAIVGEVELEVRGEADLYAEGAAVALRPGPGKSFHAKATGEQRVFFVLYRPVGGEAWRLLEPPQRGAPRRAFQTFTSFDYRPADGQLYGEWSINDQVAPLQWTWADDEVWIPIRDHQELEWAIFVVPWSNRIGDIGGSYDYGLDLSCDDAPCVPPPAT